MITIVHAVLLSVFHTVSYVGVLYISPSTRPSAGSTRATHRDDPEIIRYRVRAATIATLLSLILTSSFIYLADSKNKTWHDVLTLMGIYPTIGTIIDIFKTLLLVMILFTGRIFERYYIDDGWSNIPDEIHSYIHTWAGWRNIIAVCATPSFPLSPIFGSPAPCPTLATSPTTPATSTQLSDCFLYFYM